MTRALKLLVAASVGCLLAGLAAATWAVSAGAARPGSTAAPTEPGTALDVVIAAPLPAGSPLRGGSVRVVPLGGQAPYRVDLFVDGDWVGRDDAAPYLPAWPERVAGRHELKAKVTDADGTVRYSAAVPVQLRGAPTTDATGRKVWDSDPW